MDSTFQHGVARTSRARSEAQRQADLDKIATYRALDARLLAVNSNSGSGENDKNDKDASSALADPATLDLTAAVLARNPEHYTAWNVRRRCLTCGSLSRPSRGPSPSAPPATSSPPSTPSRSSAAASSSSSAATRPRPASPGPGRNGKSGSGSRPEAAGSEATRDGAPTEAAAVVSEEQARRGEQEQDQDSGARRPEKKDKSPYDQSQAQVLQTLRSELAFTLPLIKSNPKCYWIWNYRLWLLQQAIQLLSVAQARAVWEEELGLVALMLNKDQRNFHAWGYRRHLVRVLESPDLDGAAMPENEFRYADRMINMIGGGLSNFSAWHHRGKTIPRLLKERGADDAERRKFLDSEFDTIRRALDVGFEDQSCWYYHQLLVANMTEPVGESTIAPSLTSDDKAAILRDEIANIEELLQDYDQDIKLAYEALLDYTLLIARLEGRSPSEEEKDSLRDWLAKLRKLDPMRNGRWDDFEQEHHLKKET